MQTKIFFVFFTTKLCHIYLSTNLLYKQVPFLSSKHPKLETTPTNYIYIYHIIKSKLMAAEKQAGGIVKNGHEEGLKMAASFLQEFELPEGLLPLANVIEVGYVKETGYMWIVQQNKVEHEFKMITKLVSYDTEISGYIERKKIKKLKGVKAKELMLWPPVSEISVDDPPTGKIHFKSLAGITKTFPVEAFAAGQ
ncbi:hypothetical protein ACOSP7_002220 [Xanthoceras sorbifolium]